MENAPVNTRALACSGCRLVLLGDQGFDDLQNLLLLAARQSGDRFKDLAQLAAWSAIAPLLGFTQ